jgi:tripartite-type tricarboxylate transporter receptor subunit TctC
MRTLLLSAVGVLLTSAALAQSFPAKPVRIIVPFPAGGPSDVAARVIGQKLGEHWGQQVLVDNRPGANTLIGAEAVAKAAPDGYTLLMAIDSTLSMNQYLYSKLPYDPFRDFAPISLVCWTPTMIVTDANGPKTMRELLEQARAQPGKWNFGSGTITTQLAGELMKGMAKADLTYVPYKGSPGTVQGLLSGDVRFIIDGPTSAAPHVRSGKFRPLANLSSLPIPYLPNLPRLADEPGFAGFDVAVWLGLVAPTGTPPEIVGKIHQDVVRTLAQADVKERFGAAGFDTTSSASPAAFGTFIRQQAERWSKVIKDAGIKLD